MIKKRLDAACVSLLTETTQTDRIQNKTGNARLRDRNLRHNHGVRGSEKTVDLTAEPVTAHLKLCQDLANNGTSLTEVVEELTIGRRRSRRTRSSHPIPSIGF